VHSKKIKEIISRAESLSEKNIFGITKDVFWLEQFKEFNFKNIDATQILYKKKPERKIQYNKWHDLLKFVIDFRFVVENFERDKIVQALRAYDLPFLEIYYPFICHISKNHIIENNNLSWMAKVNAYLDLINNLIEISSDILISELQFFASDLLFDRSNHEILQDEQVYQKFVHYYYISLNSTLLENYPVMYKLLCKKYIEWKNLLLEIVDCFLKDKDLIEEKILKRRYNNWKIIDIQMGVSDAHAGGKTVCIIKIPNNKKLVYKPRNLSIDLAIQKFIIFLNQIDFPSKHKEISQITKKHYGWQEYIGQEELQSLEDAKKYFTLIGSLVFLSYLLGATDFHCGNIIAHNKYPVIIDFETVFSSYLLNHIENLSTYNFEIFDSVLASGLLPDWEKDVDLKYWDTGGISGRLFNKRKNWENVNTAKIKYDIKIDKKHISKNLPCYDGINIDSKNYLEEICQGFEKSYEFVLNNKNLVSNYLEKTFFKEDIKIRFIFRSTKVYEGFLSYINQWKFLASGIERSVQIFTLSEPFEDSPLPKAVLWNIFKKELNFMDSNHVPIFYIPIKNRTRNDHLQENILNDYFGRNTLVGIKSKMKKLSTNDKLKQIEYIKESFLAHRNNLKLK
jgi:type 2 lantibiotic biosynthesis protein LanM